MKRFLGLGMTALLLAAGCAELKGIPVRVYRPRIEAAGGGLSSAKVVDAQGSLVKTLWSDRAQAAGPVTLAWDGRNEKGEDAQPAVYRIQWSQKRWMLEPQGVFGGLGSSTGRFLSPQGLCAYPQGARLTVAVADTGNQRVQLLTDTGGFLQAVGNFGAGEERLNQPTDVDWDGQFLMVCDSQNRRLARFDATGAYLGEVRQWTGLQVGPTRNPLPTGFENPQRIKKAGGATYWVSDPGQGVLVLITSTGGVLELYGSPISLGQDGPFGLLGDRLFLKMGRAQLQVLDNTGHPSQEASLDPVPRSVGGVGSSQEGMGLVTDPDQGFLYLTDGEGRSFQTLELAGASKPGALSLWQDQLFVISQGTHEVVHYRLAPAPPEERTVAVTVASPEGLDRP